VYGLSIGNKSDDLPSTLPTFPGAKIVPQQYLASFLSEHNKIWPH